MIGNIIASAAADKINPSYATPANKQTHKSDYEEIPSHPNQRVNGGTVVATTNIKQQKPSHKEPKKTKMLISKLGDALKEVSSSSDQVPVSQRIKESKLLKDLEKKQKTYGTIQTIDVKPQESKPSTLTNIKEGIKDVYRRLSGQKKGDYSKVPTDDYDINDDFSTTLSKSKTRGQKQGTYAILPQEELDFNQEYINMTHEKELKDMMKSAKKKKIKTQEESLLDWPLLTEYKQRNEDNIRKSILRTDQAELEERIKQGLSTPPPKPQKPPKQPRTPKQQLAVNNFGYLTSRLTYKNKEGEYHSIIKDAEPLIYKREISRMKKQLEKKSADYSSQIAALETRKAVLQPDIEKHEATLLQKVMRGHIGRKQFNKQKDRKDKYENLINSGEIQEAFNKRENRRIIATTVQSAIRNKRAKMK
jgi:hypothetical protein